MYSKTSDKFKKVMSKAKFMKRAIKNKTLFKQFLIKDLQKRNRILRNKIEKETKKLELPEEILKKNDTINNNLIKLSMKRKMQKDFINPFRNNFNPMMMPIENPMMMLPSDSPMFAPMNICLLYTSPSPRDLSTSRMPSSA